MLLAIIKMTGLVAVLALAVLSMVFFAHDGSESDHW